MREEHLAVTRQLQENSREAKRARRAYAYALRRSRALTAATLTEGHQRQLLRMLRITQGDYDATVTCIEHASHPPPWMALSFEQKRELLRDLEALHTAEQIDGWTNPLTAANQASLCYLWNLWAEYRVAEWVRDTNRGRGVAPSSARVYQELLQQARVAPITLRGTLLRARTRNAKRKWAGRWRRTWSGKLGTIALGEVDDPAQFQDKALISFPRARTSNFGAAESVRERARRSGVGHISRAEKRAHFSGRKTSHMQILQDVVAF